MWIKQTHTHTEAQQHNIYLDCCGAVAITQSPDNDANHPFGSSVTTRRSSQNQFGSATKSHWFVYNQRHLQPKPGTCRLCKYM